MIHIKWKIKPGPQTWNGLSTGQAVQKWSWKISSSCKVYERYSRNSNTYRLSIAQNTCSFFAFLKPPAQCTQKRRFGTPFFKPLFLDSNFRVASFLCACGKFFDNLTRVLCYWLSHELIGPFCIFYLMWFMNNLCEKWKSEKYHEKRGLWNTSSENFMIKKRKKLKNLITRSRTNSKKINSSTSIRC